MKSDILKLILLRGMGNTQQEIADELGCSRKTVENKLKILKTNPEKLLGENGKLELILEHIVK